MKKFYIVIVIALFIAVLAIPFEGVAAEDIIKISINGKLVEFGNNTGTPFADSNGRTQVPFRITLESFGAKVDWNQATSSAIAEKDGIKVEVPLGQKYIIKNGQKIETDTVALVKNSKTYLPIRSVIEALGGTVGWDNSTKTVIIKNTIKEVSEVTFESKYVVVNVNKTKELVAKLIPADTIDRSIKWASSDSNIVSVENGLLSGRALGKATITATSNNGKSASVEVHVLNEEKTEGNGFIQETDNFIFHYTEADRSIIGELLGVLELNYDRIANKYIGSKIPVINIYVQPSVTDFHNELKRRKPSLNNTTLSKSVVGTALGSSNSILMASPLSSDKVHSHSEILQVMVHEFTHNVMAILNPNISKIAWLSEGIASYEAAQYTPQSFPQYDYIRKGQLPSINSMANGQEYIMGSTAIDFIETKFGTSGLLNLLRNSGDIQGTFGITIQEFDTQWHQFVNQKYIGK